MFIVRTAKKVWSFIVNTAEQALKAISGVLEWIGAKIEDAVMWLAEQLDWESILDVQLFLNSFVLTGIDCVQDLLLMGGEKLDGWLGTAEKEVASWHSPPELPASIANQNLETDKEKDKDKTDSMNNPLCKWADSKLQDRQVRKSMRDNKVNDTEEVTLTKVFETFYEKVLKLLWETLKDTAGHIWDDLKKLFNKGSSVTPAEVFKNTGVDLLLGIIQAIRKGVNGLIAVIIQMLKWIRSVLNEKLNIWVLTKTDFLVTESKSGPAQEKEHPSDKIRRKINTNSKFGKFIRLYRKGMMIIECGMAVWTPIDCIYTGNCWPTAMNPVQLPGNYAGAVWMRFKPVVSFVAWTISTAASMPLGKITKKRRPDGVIYRWILWAGKGYANFVKLRMPENMKAQQCGMIALADIGVYAYILSVEAAGEETDTIMELLERFLENGWALGSWEAGTTALQRAERCGDSVSPLRLVQS